MKKCKCIKKSKWFLIDDSFDLDSKLKGGEFSFQTGEVYEYDETESFFGGGTFNCFIKADTETLRTCKCFKRFFYHLKIRHIFWIKLHHCIPISVNLLSLSL